MKHIVFLLIIMGLSLSAGCRTASSKFEVDSDSGEDTRGGDSDGDQV